MRRTVVGILMAVGVPILASAGLVMAAKAPPVDEVSVTNLAWSGTLQTTEPGADVVIPLDGQQMYTVTQRAGEPLQLLAEAAASYTSNMEWDVHSACDLSVFVFDTVTGTGVRILMVNNRGEYGWGPSEAAGFAAPTADRVLQLKAVAREDPGTGCDGDYPEGAETPPGIDLNTIEDTWTVTSLQVSLVSTRD